jgi:polygalacturonase
VALYTFGGNPAAVLTTATGDVVPDYPVQVKVAGTGATVTALFEEDGTTPISELRSNGAASSQPGAIRTFKAQDVQQIYYEYLDASSQPVRWYETGREVAISALQAAQTAQTDLAGKLDKTGGTVAGALTVTGFTTHQAGASFAGDVAFAGAVTGVPSVEEMRWHNVLSYGATGDGTTDDTAGIQAALDAAYTAGGGTVVFPAGKTYCVTTFLVCRSNTTVIAHGARIKSIYATRGVFRNFFPEDSVSAYAGYSNIRVYGGTWDGNAFKSSDSSGVVTGTTNIMTFIHCSNIIVKDAVFLDCSGAHALELNAVSGARIEACRFEGFVDNTVDQSRLTSEAIQIDIAKSGSSAIGAFDNTACRDVSVVACYFGPSARLGQWGRAVGTHAIAAGSYYDRITVRDCEVVGANDVGIRASYWRNSLITGNKIVNTGESGIYATTDGTAAQACNGLVISDNIVDNAQNDAGIRIVGLVNAVWNDVVIRGNVVRLADGYGIRADYCPSVIIAANRISDPVGGGMLAQECNRATVTGNVISSAGSNGINIAGCAYGIVEGNLIDGTDANHGITVGAATSAGGNVVVEGNQIRAAANAALRIATTGCFLTSNQVRKDAAGGGVTVNGVSLAAGATGCVIAGNDLSGNAWAAGTALSLSTAAPKTDFAGGTTSPGHNLI